MGNLRDRVKTATPDTGTAQYINCGPAVPGFRRFNDAYGADAANVTYVIEDGTAWEVGVGTYSFAGDSLSRANVTASSEGGSRINLSGAATVSVTYLSRDHVSDWPYLEVFSDSGWTAADIDGYFPTIKFGRKAAVKDTTGTWNPNDGSDATWTLTQDGVYDCLLKFRLADGLPSGVSYGLGVGEGNGDGPNFSWFESGPAMRKGAIYRRVSNFTAGQKLRAFSYVDYPSSQTSITFAALTIMRVR